MIYFLTCFIQTYVFIECVVLCCTYLTLIDGEDIFDCFGTLNIRKSLSAVLDGLRYPTARHVSYLDPSDLLSHNQYNAFSATTLISFTLFLFFTGNPICPRVRIIDVHTNHRHPTSTG